MAKNAQRAGDKQKKVLNKRIARLRRSRKIKPFRKFMKLLGNQEFLFVFTGQIGYT